MYDPASGEVHSDDPSEIAAWFLDQDYDRKSFLVGPALLPGAGRPTPWERLSRALKGWVDPDAFEMFGARFRFRSGPVPSGGRP